MFEKDITRHAAAAVLGEFGRDDRVLFSPVSLQKNHALVCQSGGDDIMLVDAFVNLTGRAPFSCEIDVDRLAGSERLGFGLW